MTIKVGVAPVALAALLWSASLAVSRAADPPFRFADVAQQSGVVLLNIAGTKANLGGPVPDVGLP